MSIEDIVSRTRLLDNDIKVLGRSILDLQTDYVLSLDYEK